MRRIGLFVDVGNLYHCLRKKYKGKLSYKKLFEYVADLGDIQIAIAYGAQIGKEAQGFINCLKQFGYETKFKQPRTFKIKADSIKRKADWDVGIAVDIIRYLDQIDMVVLGTADGDFEPIVQYAREYGKIIVIIGTGISHELTHSADECIEIPESLLEVL